MIAVVPIRAGRLPLGGEETIAECGGEAILVGDGCRAALAEISVATRSVVLAEAGPFAPAAWSEALAPLLAPRGIVVLPGSPDGRDLAPHLARALGRPLWAGATAVSEASVVVSRHEGRTLLAATVESPVVATLIPGVRGVPSEPSLAGNGTVEELPLAVPDRPAATTIELLAPSAASMELAEAPRIVAGGAGLGTPETFALLGSLAEALDATVGATRVAVDRGWASHERQIGTTGAVVRPELYLALGVSGAVQHLAAVEPPAHVVSVNLDASCPMMAAADLAVVADAPAVVRALLDALGVQSADATEAAHA